MTYPLEMRVRIEGKPKGKERARSFIYKDKKTGKQKIGHYTADSTESWEKNAALRFKEANIAYFGIGEIRVLPPPLRISVLAVVKRPKSMCKKSDVEGIIWRAAKPDGDNVLKCVGDALNNSGIILDDRHVVDWMVQSAYGPKDSNEEYVIVIIDRPESLVNPSLELFFPVQYQPVQEGTERMLTNQLNEAIGIGK